MCARHGLTILVFLFIVLGAMIQSEVASQPAGEAFPSRAITMIIPWGPGSGGDIATRILVASMEKSLRQPIVVQNITGAGGIRGAVTLWRSKPDGYTIGMNYLQHMITGQIFEEKEEYDIKKFGVVGQFVTAKYILSVPKGSPFRSVKDFAKAKEPVRFCVTNPSENPAVTAMALSNEVGFAFTLIPGYQSAAQAIVGSIRGDCDATIYGSVAQPFVDRGDLIPLLAFSSDRIEFFPNVPTYKEVGLPKYLEDLASLNYIIWAPPGTSQERLQILEEAMIKATEANKDKFKERFYFPAPLSGKTTKEMIPRAFDYFLKFKDIVEQYKRK